MLVVNAANVDKDWKLVRTKIIRKVSILKNASDRMAQLAVQGAESGLKFCRSSPLLICHLSHIMHSRPANLPE